ncbi:hypothetical protein DSL64_26785 [Dyadobacter luteus]|uniref:C1q domain-containing protein n=1 Tax=Dyadobacter luteus TaxID=2259619 RepID=A0A3D8Y6K8_9BACT|nr:hypothetical protein [Dyadobacter luteus]REA56526.1 hypothetical protein DSL64_26785 [Dyadobacter luteus]
MHVYNTNVNITSTKAGYPTLPAKVGEYYWDGTGWVAIGQSGSQFSPVQVQITSAGQQEIYGNSAHNTIVYPTTVFDVGGNKVGNTVVIPSAGLYDLNVITSWVATQSSALPPGAWTIRLYVNGAFTDQFAAGRNVFDTSMLQSGRVLKRLTAGDVVSVVMFTQQTSGNFRTGFSTFTVTKISN